jgi:hypothetical protein
MSRVEEGMHIADWTKDEKTTNEIVRYSFAWYK